MCELLKSWLRANAACHSLPEEEAGTISQKVCEVFVQQICSFSHYAYQNWLMGLCSQYCGIL